MTEDYNKRVQNLLRNFIMGDLVTKSDALQLVIEYEVANATGNHIPYDKDGAYKPILVAGVYRYVSTSNVKAMQDYITRENKIPAIKILRELTGCGLKEAKDAVEDCRNFKQPPPRW